MSQHLVDLRSDTMTRPTPTMRNAMARADVGDDVWREDPTVKRLEASVASLLGFSAALFVPSGTMANQLALLVHCQPGDEVLTAAETHIAHDEAGAAAALAHVQVTEVAPPSAFTASRLSSRIRPPDSHGNRTRLLWIENTHNRAGGRLFPPSEFVKIVTLARANVLPLHVDGARLFNAALAAHLPPATLLSGADSASICLSKGLGAPVGSVLAGTSPFIEKARHWRQRLGGAMRQSGILAAAGLYALDHHLDRLATDHENAQRLAADLAEIQGLTLPTTTIDTNIVLFDLAPEAPDPPIFLARCAKAGILLCPFEARRIRAVTHLDVNADDCLRATATIRDALRAS
ncbi:MAG: aminotransferase class I/II-fold pyridoxal phosphate-dependent enzyme [Deltaproteobacteria bacterium]|nr:aminotransferase class I/II-fold pyridoxal phosphate-dependent enzyme [Deltaproteobacteria bacterium]